MHITPSQDGSVATTHSYQRLAGKANFDTASRKFHKANVSLIAQMHAHQRIENTKHVKTLAMQFEKCLV